MQTANINRPVPTTTSGTDTVSRKSITLLGLSIKTIVVHTVTYLIMGLLALMFLEYRTAFEAPITREYMRSVDGCDRCSGAGASIHPRYILRLRLLPAAREILFARKNGWLITWLVLVMVGILSPFGAAPGSVEGLLYTKMPVALQISGWVEIMSQALLLSALLYYWVNHPEKKWIAWVLGIIYVLVWVFGIMGVVFA